MWKYSLASLLILAQSEALVSFAQDISSASSKKTNQAHLKGPSTLSQQSTSGTLERETAFQRRRNAFSVRGRYLEHHPVEDPTGREMIVYPLLVALRPSVFC